MRRYLYVLVFVLILLFGCSGVLWAQENVEVNNDDQTAKEEKNKKIYDLGQVVVTGTKTNKVLEDVPVETTVINREEIESSNSDSISDLLVYTPGINAVMQDDRRGIEPWRMSFRGLNMNNGYALILIDGKRNKGGGMGEYGYGANLVPPEMIERIEIVKGPGSTLYGHDAMAGVINVITRPIPEEMIFRLDGSYGPKDDRDVGVVYGDRVGNIGFLINASGEQSGVGKYGSSDEYNGKFINAKIGLVEENYTIVLNSLYNYDEYSTSVWKGGSVDPTINYYFEDGSSLMARAYYYDQEFHHFSPGYTELNGNMGYSSGELQYNRPFGDFLLVTLGTEYLNESIDYELVPDKTIDNIAGILQAEFFLLDQKLDFILGLRVDNHSEWDTWVSPRVSAMYVLTPSTRLRFSAGHGFKSPTLRQMYYVDLYKHGDHFSRSNPDLDPESLWGYSLGLEQEFAEQVLVNIGLFRYDVKDMIVGYDTGETAIDPDNPDGDPLPISSYENTSEACTQGVELEVRAQITENLSSVLNFTYLDAKNKENDKRITYQPEYTAGVRIFQELPDFGLNLSAGARYVGSYYTNSDNTKKKDEYTVWEAKATKVVNKNLKFSLAAENIFETDFGEDRDTTSRLVDRYYTAKVTMSY